MVTWEVMATWEAMAILQLVGMVIYQVESMAMVGEYPMVIEAEVPMET